jgi:hypothetical protein
MASSLVILQSFRSLFTDSSLVKFGLPRPLLTLSARFSHSQCTGYLEACAEYAQTILNDAGQAFSATVTPCSWYLIRKKRMNHLMPCYVCWRNTLFSPTKNRASLQMIVPLSICAAPIGSEIRKIIVPNNIRFPLT